VNDTPSLIGARTNTVRQSFRLFYKTVTECVHTNLRKYVCTLIASGKGVCERGRSLFFDFLLTLAAVYGSYVHVAWATDRYGRLPRLAINDAQACLISLDRLTTGAVR
jgi:hypothetical protein